MLLGTIVGKTSTNEFRFLVKGNARKHQYIQTLDKEGRYVLAQITEIEKDSEKTIAYCNIIGYREDNVLKSLKYPLDPGIEILNAEDSFIRETLGLEQKDNFAYIGFLDGRKNLKVYLDLNRLLTKHLAIIAKSGSGKSFFSGVLLEELLEKNIPVIVIDPHGEYSTLKYPAQLSDNEFGVKPRDFLKQIQEYSSLDTIGMIPLKLNNKGLSGQDFLNLLPAKLTNAQLGVFYSALKNLNGEVDFNRLILEIENQDSNVKWSLINIIEYLQNLNLFSSSYTRMGELIQYGKLSIINLKGVNPEVQEVIVYKLVRDLFDERKKGNIPPFFLVIEEAHNFIPERSFGEAKSSGIIRQVASEGRKFGMGLGIITQRPARIDKNVLSQCTTQVILKVTNPHDIRAVVSSVEGINSQSEKDIQGIPIGTAMVTGIVDLPLFVNVRPRKTKHGGEAIEIIGKEEVAEEKEETKNFVHELTKSKDKELLPIIKPRQSKEDLRFMHGNVKIRTKLIPCLYVKFSKNFKEFNVLFNLNNGGIINDIKDGSGFKFNIKRLDDLSPNHRKVFNLCFNMNEFKAADLFAKSQMQFSEIYDVINSLIAKNYLIRVNDKLKLSGEFEVLNKLEEFNLYEEVDFSNVEYDEKMEKKVDSKYLVDFLSNFLNIKNERECWLVSYEI